MKVQWQVDGQGEKNVATWVLFFLVCRFCLVCESAQGLPTTTSRFLNFDTFQTKRKLIYHHAAHRLRQGQRELGAHLRLFLRPEPGSKQ